MNIKIIIATHKKYRMPSEPVYLPLHVGAEGKTDIGYTRDNTGDNISEKNSGFCELTGLYWAWKNLACDYLGLVHYRRYFTVRSHLYIFRHKNDEAGKMESILSGKELEKLLTNYDILVPRKRRYIIETLYSHYSHTHYVEHLDMTRQIILEKYPEYISEFDYVMKKKSGYMFNMFVMPKKISDSYCEWLFDILLELERRVNMPELSGFQGRFYGRVSEIIFNVWLEYQVKQHDFKIGEINFFYMEPVKWRKKINAFLKAKFFHKKYEGSF